MAKARKRKVQKEYSMVAILRCVLDRVDEFLCVGRSIGYSVWTNKYVMNLKYYYVINFICHSLSLEGIQSAWNFTRLDYSVIFANSSLWHTLKCVVWKKMRVETKNKK